MSSKTYHKNLSSLIGHLVRKDWPGYAAVLFLGVLWSLNENTSPYCLKLIIDYVSHSQREEFSAYPVLLWPLIGFLGGRLLMEMAMRMRGVIMASLFPSLRHGVQSALFEHASGHSQSYFSKALVGSLGNKVTKVASSSLHLMWMCVIDFIPLLTSFGISFYFLAQIQILFSFIISVWVILYIFLSFWLFGRKSLRLSMDVSSAENAVQGKIVDALSNIMTVRLFARAHYELMHLKELQTQEACQRRRFLLHLEKMRVFQAVACIILLTVVTALLMQGWQAGWVTLGDFTFIFNITLNILGMTGFIASQLTHLVEELGLAKQSLQDIAQPHEICDRENSRPLRISRGEVVFEDICFHYEGNRPLFAHFSLVIQAGEKVGIVGPSGAGKSTLINLLLRYYEPHQGRIKIDGTDIAAVTQQSLRESIALIPQDSSLFHRSLLENIRYGKISASDEEVIVAAKNARCHDFIQSLPEKYHTPVGERGLKLSGGQRQRIAIARAFLKNAPLLVLDEATSALDSVTEILIQESLKDLIQNRTVIAIAHRLSTLLHMDRILVLQGGEIVEEGTHDELLMRGGHYAELWHLQAGGVKETFQPLNVGV